MKWIQEEGVDFKPYGPNERGTYYTQMFQVRGGRSCVCSCMYMIESGREKVCGCVNVGCVWQCVWQRRRSLPSYPFTNFCLTMHAPSNR
jgi:hypothetical protein